MMNDRFKKKVAYVTLGSFGSAVLFPAVTDCWRGQLCSIDLPEMWHVEQQDQAPPQPVLNVLQTAGTTSTGGYTLTFGARK